MIHVQSALAIGGSQGETLAAAALDPSGNLFLAGTTTSVARSSTITKGSPLTPFPVTPGALNIAAGAQNAFIAKFDSARNLNYSAVLGSSGTDSVLSLTVDNAGDAYLSGVPGSSDFPTLDGQGLPPTSGAFAAKISPDGTRLLYSYGIAINPAYVAASSTDSNGNLYLVVTGPTSIPLLPPDELPAFPFASFVPTSDAATICATSPAYLSRAALIQLAPDGSLALSSYFPFPSPAPLLVDSTGKVYVIGRSLPFDIFDPKSLTAATSLCVVNAADTVDGPLIPGEIIAVHGIGIGPPQPASFQLTNGLVPSTLGGVSLLINGIAAPLLYVSENQINAVVPFEVPESYSPISIRVVNSGVSSNALTYSTGIPTQTLAIFTHGNTYDGRAYAYNSDGTLNGPDNPASAGSSVTLLTTGNGIPSNGQLPVDGSLGTGQPFFFPNTVGPVGLPGNEQFPVIAVTDDPGVVEGLVTVTATIPQDAGTGQLMMYPNGYIYVR